MQYDPRTRLYTSPDAPGQYFKYVFSDGGKFEHADPPAPANCGPSEPANAETPPLASPSDALALIQAYRALPLSERKRFWMFVDEAEEDFSIEQMRRLVLKADAAGIDFRDRDAFEAFLKTQTDKPANGTPRAFMLAPSEPANGPGSYEHGLIQANNGDPSVYFVEGGRRHGIPAPHVMRERFHSDFVDGRWTGVIYVDPSVVAAIPLGAPVLSPYEGKLLQAGRPRQDVGLALGALLGPAAGAAAAYANLEPADPSVWHIVNGQRRGIASPAVLTARYGSTWEDGILGGGHWTKVQLVDPALISEFPVGPTETLNGSTDAGAAAGAPPG